MNIVLAVVTAVCAGYMAYSMKDGVPESLSATYYTLGRWGWVFQTVMFLVGILLWPVWHRLSGDTRLWMVFLSCASLLFVAAAPAFKLELEGRVHYGSAVVCCVCAVAWQVAEGLWDVTLWFGFLGGMLSLAMREKWCWWMECAVVGSLLVNLWRAV